jgi:hypothetical protein
VYAAEGGQLEYGMVETSTGLVSVHGHFIQMLVSNSHSLDILIYWRGGAYIEGQGGCLGDSVGLDAVGESRGVWAVSSIHVNDLGGVDYGIVVPYKLISMNKSWISRESSRAKNCFQSRVGVISQTAGQRALETAL